MSSQLGSVTRRKTHVTMKNGKRLEIAQLGLGDMGYLREQAAHHYRDEAVKAFKDASELLDLLPPEERLKTIRDEVTRIRHMTPDELPMKTAKLLPRRKADGTVKMKNGLPVLREQNVEYFVWWMDATIEGKLQTAYRSLQMGSTPMTLDEVDAMFMEELPGDRGKEDLDGFTEEIDRLTESELGNSSSPDDGDQQTAETKKARRQQRKQNRGKTGRTESGSYAKTTKG